MTSATDASWPQDHVAIRAERYEIGKQACKSRALGLQCACIAPAIAMTGNRREAKRRVVPSCCNMAERTSVWGTVLHTRNWVVNLLLYRAETSLQSVEPFTCRHSFHDTRNR